jgi:hypothetical protein
VRAEYGAIDIDGRADHLVDESIGASTPFTPTGGAFITCLAPRTPPRARANRA